MFPLMMLYCVWQHLGSFDEDVGILYKFITTTALLLWLNVVAIQFPYLFTCVWLSCRSALHLPFIIVNSPPGK